ncbi:MAG TPA: GNAT family N-acetyltransferase [Thermoanaerobaculia bacterium]|nr:GNAT family N-acetyltransferase [Thermoanaerobaculia bacterium]
MITLRTERLTLRPFTIDDAPAVQQHCSTVEVARNTLLIPHPYPEGAAEQWIAKHAEDWAENRIQHFAIDDGQLAGAMGLVMKGDAIAEIGYWIGPGFWNRGYATEAAREIVRYGFEEAGLHRIFAGYFTRNAASGRVLEKIGMKYEGTLRHHICKWGEYLDVAYYGILRDEFSSRS